MGCLEPSFVAYQTASCAAVACSVVLYCRFQLALLLLVPMLTIAVMLLFFLDNAATEHGWVDSAGLAKVMCALPLGLGSILLFSSLSPSTQMKYTRHFALYVNAAVLGNIAMMAFLPSAGTLRGQTSRATCFALSLWLALEMKRAGPFDCVAILHDPVITQRGPQSASTGISSRPVPSSTEASVPLFVFSASPLPWIVSHALYRMVLVTLPAFDSWRYVLLEVTSLSVMTLVYRMKRTTCTANHRGVSTASTTATWKCLKLSHCFGIADTVTVATMGTLSHIADHLVDPKHRPMNPLLQGGSGCPWDFHGLVAAAAPFLDIGCVVVHAAIIAVAAGHCHRLLKVV